MSLQSALQALTDMQKSLTITSPFVTQIKEAYIFPPSRAQSGLPDVPCWINVWGLTALMNWGQWRVERYTVTMQLLCQDGDTFTGEAIATAFATAFINAWDATSAFLVNETVHTELTARDPTLVNLEWGGKSYQGLQFMLSMDIAVDAIPEYIDDVILTLENWTFYQLPCWQQNPLTWAPTDDCPGILWHHVTLPAPLDGEFINLEVQWQGCTVAALINTPSNSGTLRATTTLSQALGRSMPDYMQMPDKSWMQYSNIRTFMQIDPAAEGQLEMNVKFWLDQSIANEIWTQQGPPIDPAIVTWAEDDEEGDGRGPTIAVTSHGIEGQPPLPAGAN